METENFRTYHHADACDVASVWINCCLHQTSLASGKHGWDSTTELTKGTKEKYSFQLFVYFVFFVVRVLTPLRRLLHLDGTHLVFRDLCNRIVGRIGENVGTGLGKMEWQEHHTHTHPVGHRHLCCDFTPAGSNLH